MPSHRRLHLIPSAFLFLLAATLAKAGTLTVYLSPPAAQTSTVTGATTETFDGLDTGVRTTAYSPAQGIGTYTGSSTNPMAILAPVKERAVLNPSG